MVLKASEISELIKQRIEGFEDKAEARDVGTVITLTAVSYTHLTLPTKA